MNVLINEEDNLKLEIINLRNGNIKKKKRIYNKNYEALTKSYYQKYDEKIKSFNSSNNNIKNKKIVEIWYDVCLELPINEYLD